MRRYYAFHDGYGPVAGIPGHGFETDREAIAYAVGRNVLERANNFSPGLLERNLIQEITLVETDDCAQTTTLRSVIGVVLRQLTSLNSACSSLRKTDN